MSQVTKRRIQVASFSMADVSSGHLAMMAAGAILVLTSAGLAVASNANARAAADARGAARLLSIVSGHTLQGTRLFGGGGSERLGQAASLIPMIDSAFAEVASSSDSLMVLQDLQGPASDAYASWSGLNAALAPIAPAALGVAELSEGLGAAAGNLAGLVRKLEAAGRTSGSNAKGYEASLRLYTYAEGGFGLASLARVEFDLQTLSAELGGSDLRQDVALVESLRQLAREASSKKVTKEQLTAAFEVGRSAKVHADALLSIATRSQVATWLGLSAGALVLLGLAVFVGGLRSATSEFSKRYNRSMQQFRGDESVREHLLAGLRKAGDGDLTADIEVPPDSEFNSIASQINRVLALSRAQLGHAVGSLSRNLAFGAEAIDAADRAQQAAGCLVSDLAASEKVLTACADKARDLAFDSRALVHVASEAQARSADATRIVQDSASRLEAMREGLQDTAKRVKRLGERSQEMNEVVEGLELLSEQIGVLALNASMEAERAGEAGAGFRLVAKEVQSLGARSEDALVRISGLVHGVQADARSAAESVERSTSQVVAGANVGSISNALLSVLAPLTESIGAMALSVAKEARENASAMLDSAGAAAMTRQSAVDVVGHVGSVRQPVATGRERVSLDLDALHMGTAELAS